MKYTLREVLENDSSVSVDSIFNYWVCKEDSLEKKAKSLLRKVKFFVDTFSLDLDSYIVNFRNSKSILGHSFDSIKLTHINGNINFYIVPNRNLGERRTSVYVGDENMFSDFHFLNWREFKSDHKCHEEIRLAIK